jgi:hypothetical protein
MTIFTTRADLMALPAFAQMDTDDDGNPCVWLNTYICPECGATWEDRWSCQCDNECGECGTTCAPEESLWNGPDDDARDMWESLSDAGAQPDAAPIPDWVTPSDPMLAGLQWTPEQRAAIRAKYLGAAMEPNRLSLTEEDQPRQRQMNARSANIAEFVMFGKTPYVDDDHQNELVSRSAPRWAWDTIDETLDMDRRSTAFTADLRDTIGAAVDAMTLACERADDEPISRKDVTG